MKLTQTRLRRIIKEEYSKLTKELFDPTGQYAKEFVEGEDEEELDSGDAKDHEGEEYKRGYQDALDGEPRADDATSAYDAGYEDGEAE